MTLKRHYRDNCNIDMTPQRKQDRKPTLSAHCWYIPTFTNHFPHHDLQQQELWLTKIDKRCMKWKTQLLHSTVFLCCFVNRQIPPLQHTHTHIHSTLVTFPVIEPVTLGADTSLTAARGGTGSGCRQEKRKSEVKRRDASPLPIWDQRHPPFLSGSETDTHLYLLVLLWHADTFRLFVYFTSYKQFFNIYNHCYLYSNKCPHI